MMLFFLWSYIACRSKERHILFLLDKIRTRLRAYQQNISQLNHESSAFSPNDPEPFGELSEIFNLRMIDFQKSIAQVYENYGGLHRNVNNLVSAPAWKRWFDFVRWNNLEIEVSYIYSEIEQIEEQYNQLVQSADKLKQLGLEISKQCLEAIEQLNDTRLMLQNLQSHFTGTTFANCQRNVSKWDGTLKTQIPVSFLSVNNRNSDYIFEKDEIAKVHRVLITAAPGIFSLFVKVKKWSDDLRFVMSSMPDLKEKQIAISNLMNDLETRILSPIKWDNSQDLAESIQNQIDLIKASPTTLSVESLRELLHTVEWATAQQAGLLNHCNQVLIDYNELLRLWSSIELQQGTDWVKGVKKVLDTASDYDDVNWQSIDDIGNFRSQMDKLAQIQLSMLPRDPTRPLQESMIGKLLDETRLLFDLHQKLRPRLDLVQERLKNIQSLQDDAKERLAVARSVLAKTLPVISSNPTLRKGFGKEAENLRVSLDALIKDLETQEGSVEKKVQKVNQWISKADKAMNKWLDALVIDLDDHLATLGESFQTLGYFLNIQDLVITEAKEILKKVENPDRFGMPLSRLGDAPLFVTAKKLWATSDDWQKVFSVERALIDIAAPVIERFKKVEKSREAAMSQVAKGDRLIPVELQWPPTAQYLGSERKQYQNLEANWQMLRQEPIQAIQLVGKLSDFTVQYHDVAAQVLQKNEKAEQEQARIIDYERKLVEAKRLWQGIIEKYPEYKTLRIDLEKFFVEIDREYVNLKKQYTLGGLPYNQALHNLRMICRKVNEITMPAVGNQVVDINGELQKRVY